MREDFRGELVADWGLDAGWEAGRLLSLRSPRRDLCKTRAGGGSWRRVRPSLRVLTMHRSAHAPELLDAALPPPVGRNAPRERLTQLIDWVPLEAQVADLPAAPSGCWPATLVFASRDRAVESTTAWKRAVRLGAPGFGIAWPQGQRFVGVPGRRSRTRGVRPRRP